MPGLLALLTIDQADTMFPMLDILIEIERDYEAYIIHRERMTSIVWDILADVRA
jgi:hypothetical protein